MKRAIYKPPKAGGFFYGGTMKNKFLAGLALMILTGCTTANGFKSDKAELSLKGNPSTGYNWIVQIEDENIISIEEKTEYLGSNGVVGAPSMFYYTIRSLNPGTTTLRFEYRRPWESNPPLELHLYDVTVEKNGNLILRALETE